MSKSVLPHDKRLVLRAALVRRRDTLIRARTAEIEARAHRRAAIRSSKDSNAIRKSAATMLEIADEFGVDVKYIYYRNARLAIDP